MKERKIGEYSFGSSGVQVGVQAVKKFISEKKIDAKAVLTFCDAFSDEDKKKIVEETNNVDERTSERITKEDVALYLVLWQMLDDYLDELSPEERSKYRVRHDLYLPSIERSEMTINDWIQDQCEWLSYDGRTGGSRSLSIEDEKFLREKEIEAAANGGKVIEYKEDLENKFKECLLETKEIVGIESEDLMEKFDFNNKRKR